MRDSPFPISVVQFLQSIVIHVCENCAAGCGLPPEFAQWRFFPKMKQGSLWRGAGVLMQAAPGALCKHRLGLAGRDGEKSSLFRNVSWHFAVSLVAILHCGNRKDGTKFKSQNRMKTGNEFQALPLSTFSNGCSLYTKANCSFLKLLLPLWLYLFCPFCILILLVKCLSTLGGKAPHSCTSRILDKLACELSCAFLQRLQIFLSSELKSSFSLVISDCHQLSSSDSTSFLLKTYLHTQSSFSRRPPDFRFQLCVSNSLTLQRGTFTVQISPV